MLSPRPAACAGPACVQHACTVYYSQAQLTVPVCTCIFLCDFLWPKIQSHSDDSHMHVTAQCSARVLSQARPTMLCIHLVLYILQ